ncbi:MAG TPA: alpha/beta hydrolase fold domain-containing protein [Solirubrobacteraceae bacterium]|jgi:acetyl esterase/lipase
MASLTAVLATSLLGLLGLGPPPPKPVQPPKPAEALVASPASDVKGTMIMVHGGGWQGPGEKSQKYLMEQPGEMLVQRGWRVISVDYDAGTAGITDVLNAAGQELQRAEGNPLCLYGESAGAQIALVVAARLKAIDCVIAAGAPTDFHAYMAEAKSSGDGPRAIIAGQMETVFGSTEDVTAAWEPVKLSSKIASDVLMLREADDRLIPREQLDRFLAARPTTESAELESDLEATPETWWLHGTLSDAGRERYLAAIGGFADRAVAMRVAERAAERSGCQGTDAESLVTMTGALRCLARNGATRPRARKSRGGLTTRRLRGEVNAARVWASLDSSASGRRALTAFAARRASFNLRSANPSIVTLRGR